MNDIQRADYQRNNRGGALSARASTRSNKQK